MADPVSWLVIEPGWRVLSADGQEVGRVEEVAGDSHDDIFDGIVVGLSALGQPRYAAAEQVGEITDGAVRLKLDRAAAEALPPYQEPGETVEISAEKASLGTRIESDLRPQSRTERLPLTRRILLWFGLAGKR